MLLSGGVVVGSLSFHSPAVHVSRLLRMPLYYTPPSRPLDDRARADTRRPPVERRGHSRWVSFQLLVNFLALPFAICNTRKR